jgi:hypothetical protein
MENAPANFLLARYKRGAHSAGDFSSRPKTISDSDSFKQLVGRRRDERARRARDQGWASLTHK